MKNMDSTKYDLSLPIEVFRPIITRRRNIIQTGIHRPGTVPEEFMTEYYCKPNVTVTPEINTKSSISISSTTGTLKIENLNKEKHPSDKVVLEPTITATKTTSLDINKASRNQLTKLNGIGGGTADKLIELREASPFIDFYDLNDRVPLSFGKTWQNFEISFDN